MNTTLSTPTSRLDHPPQQQAVVRVRRVGLFDRMALRVGLALVTWGRRPLVVDAYERRANRLEQELAQLERERSSENALRLLQRML